MIWFPQVINVHCQHDSKLPAISERDNLLWSTRKGYGGLTVPIPTDRQALWLSLQPASGLASQPYLGNLSSPGLPTDLADLRVVAVSSSLPDLHNTCLK